MVVFWEPLSMGSSSSIILFKSFQFHLIVHIVLIYFFASVRVSLLDAKPEVKAIKLPKPFFCLVLFFVLFLKEQKHGTNSINSPNGSGTWSTSSSTPHKQTSSPSWSRF